MYPSSVKVDASAMKTAKVKTPQPKHVASVKKTPTVKNIMPKPAAPT
tara:strand:+ start:362 stop:502 length:141 start_codon:yes stop_codon:yes gene_type:complete